MLCFFLVLVLQQWDSTMAEYCVDVALKYWSDRCKINTNISCLGGQKHHFFTEISKGCLNFNIFLKIKNASQNILKITVVF
jgi:hypothetical protein